MPGVTIRLAGTPWRTHRPPPARCGKRGQQVRRWLERRGRRAVRPPSQIAQRTVSPVDPSVGNAACSPQAARLGSTWPGGRVVAAATCCFTVGTDPGWVRMYEATWRGYRQHSCGNTLQGLSAKPPGGSRAGRRARETGGVGKPARFCQEETHVLAEQFSSMEHDAFRVPYLPDKKRSKPHSMDRPSTAAKHDPPHRTTSSRNAGRLDGS